MVGERFVGGQDLLKLKAYYLPGGRIRADEAHDPLVGVEAQECPCSGGGGKTPVFHADRVYARDFTGNEILDAGTGRLLGTFQAGPAPAFAGKIGLFLNGSTLQAASSHRTLWTFSGDGGLDSAPVSQLTLRCH